MRRIVVAALAACLLTGCTERTAQVADSTSLPQPTLGTSEAGYVLIVAVDLSGSFRDRMAEQGEAYKFLIALIERYFADRVGTDDRLVIAQLSGTKNSLVWEGKPLELRQQFPSPEAFREHLMKHQDPGGSLIYDGIRHALEYVLSDPDVQSGKAKPGLFILSDMLDNGKDPMSEGYMNHELSQLGHLGGVAGIYYADQQEVVRWRQRLPALRVKNHTVQASFATPSFPSFE